MDSSFYEISNVVLGLRNEYQRMESKLQELRKYAKLDSKYDNLHFSLNERKINYDYTSKNKSPKRMVSSYLFGSYVEKKKQDKTKHMILKYFPNIFMITI